MAKANKYNKPSIMDRIIYGIVSGREEKRRLKAKKKALKAKKKTTGSTQTRKMMSNLSKSDYDEIQKRFGKK